VNFLLDHDTKDSLRYAAIGSPVGQALMDHMGLPRDMDAIIFVDHDEYYLKSDGFLKIIERTSLAPYAKLGWLLPRPLREAILYANRERFGESDQCFVEDLDDRFVSDLPAGGMEKLFADDDRPVLVYDGSCRLCDAWVSFVLDRGVDVRFAASQTAAGKALKDHAAVPDDVLVLVAADHAFENADAVLELCARAPDDRLNTLAAVLSALLPGALRTTLFDFVSKNRHRILATTDYCVVNDPRKASSFLVDLPADALRAVVPAA